LGIAGSLAPPGIGIAARTWGLGPAIWLPLAGPVSQAVGLPPGLGSARQTTS